MAVRSRVATPAGLRPATRSAPRSLSGRRWISRWWSVVPLTLVVVAALAAPLIAPHDPLNLYREGLSATGSPLPPGGPFLLGTDPLGRDVLSRIIFGARTSLGLAVLANGVTLALGVGLGLVAGFRGGLAGMVIMRVADVLMGIPMILFAVALAAVLGPSLWALVLVIGFVSWTYVARIVFGEVLAIKEREFIMAARAIGAGQLRILRRHVFPQILPLVIIYGALGLATTIRLEASLSFLGAGVRPPTPTWGGMIFEGAAQFRVAPWLVVYPGLALMLTILSLTMFGEALRRRVDPRSGSEGRVG